MLAVSVKLAHIGQKILFGFIIVGKKIDISLDEFALTDKENLDAHPPFFHIIAENIPVHQILMHDPLLGAKETNGLNQISVLCRPFKFHMFRSLGHLLPQLVDNFVILAIEEVFDILF